MEYNTFKITEKLKNFLPDKRYIHTLGVAYTSACLAMKFNYNINKAQTAGLLHDCAKYMSEDKMYKKCREFNISITESEEKNMFLLHSKLGVHFAKNVYNVQDEEILNAVRYHTTGKADMNLIEKIVFVADYIEPSRPIIPGLEEIRKMAFIDIDRTVYMIMQNTLSYLEEKHRVIEETTIEAYKYYKKIILREE